MENSLKRDAVRRVPRPTDNYEKTLPELIERKCPARGERVAAIIKSDGGVMCASKCCRDCPQGYKM